jgi:hypothetical protein
MMSRLMGRPRPVPSPTGLVVKKGSKMRSRFSGAIPQPLSCSIRSAEQCGVATEMW